MTPFATLAIQLALLAAGAIFAVLAASSARRAASFDVTRDFDALASAVAKLQQVARSQHMSRVRQAGIEHPAPQPAPSQAQPMSHSELRALARARNGAHQ